MVVNVDVGVEDTTWNKMYQGMLGFFKCSDTQNINFCCWFLCGLFGQNISAKASISRLHLAAGKKCLLLLFDWNISLKHNEN